MTGAALRRASGAAANAATAPAVPGSRRPAGAIARSRRTDAPRGAGLKAIVRRAAVDLGLVRTVMRLGGPEVLRILRYHAVTPDAPYCSASIAVTPQQFDRQLAYLRDHYRVLTLPAAVEALRQDAPLPRRAVCITFDDGYLDNFAHAFPLLQKHGLSATFFVTVAPIMGTLPFWVGWLQSLVSKRDDVAALAQRFGLPAPVGGFTPDRRQALIDHISSSINRGGLAVRDDALAEIRAWAGAEGAADHCPMMTVDQLRTMTGAGMTIGSHTLTHPVLAALSGTQALHELSESKRLLEAALDRPVDHLAYPNGPGLPINFTDETKRLARQAGYLSASTSVRGVASKASDPFALERHGINRRLDDAAFAFKLEEHRFGLGRRAAIAEGGS